MKTLHLHEHGDKALSISSRCHQEGAEPNCQKLQAIALDQELWKLTIHRGDREIWRQLEQSHMPD
jgi:hypothetical protein